MMNVGGLGLADWAYIGIGRAGLVEIFVGSGISGVSGVSGVFGRAGAAVLELGSQEHEDEDGDGDEDEAEEEDETEDGDEAEEGDGHEDEDGEDEDMRWHLYPRPKEWSQSYDGDSNPVNWERSVPSSLSVNLCMQRATRSSRRSCRLLEPIGLERISPWLWWCKCLFGVVVVPHILLLVLDDIGKKKALTRSVWIDQ